MRGGQRGQSFHPEDVKVLPRERDWQRALGPEKGGHGEVCRLPKKKPLCLLPEVAQFVAQSHAAFVISNVISAGL